MVARGYRALKFDPFGTAWQRLSSEEMAAAELRVAEVRDAVGPDVDVFIEVHGRLSGEAAIAMGRRLEKFGPASMKNPTRPTPDLLKEVKSRCLSALPPASGCI